MTGETAWGLPEDSGTASSAVSEEANSPNLEASSSNLAVKGSISQSGEGTEDEPKLVGGSGTEDDETGTEEATKLLETGTMQDELPSEWVEMTDPASGKPYFYNTVSNETSWERPAVVVEEPSLKEDAAEEAENELQEAPETDHELQGDIGLSHGEELEPSEEHTELPAGWTEAIDPTQGQRYYYNEQTGETSWDRPSFEADPTGNIDMSSRDAIVPKVPERDLPGDWEDVNGPEETHQPVAPERSIDPSGLIDQPHGGDVLITAGRTSKQDSLPDGWTEVEDPQSQQVYYYNEGTGETSWYRPTKASEANAFEERVERDGWEVVEGHTLEEKQSAAPTTTNRRDSKQTTRLPHASAHMAFGRLCRLVSGSNGRTCIEIQPLHELIKHDGFVKATRTKREYGIFGPLHKTEDEEVVRSYIKEKEQKERTDLLWRLIHIAGSSKGKLRSLAGAADPNSPESSIVEVLLEDAPVPRSAGVTKVDAAGSEASSEPNMAAIQQLLVKGEREEAVEMAVRERQYALALLVAGMCDRETYARVAKEFCDNAIPRRSPLHTIAVMFSSPSQAYDKSALSALFERDAAGLKDSWKSHLAAIINNRITGWEAAVAALGDRLREAGCFEAAHFCFMVCGTPLLSPVQRDSKWTLVGCNVTPADVILRTETSIGAFLRTEAYEWAKRRGNPRANIKTLQAFTALYAVRLAEYGFVKEAANYAESVLECFGKPPGTHHMSTGSSKPLGLAVLSGDKVSLVSALSILHERLQSHVKEGERESIQTAAVVPETTGAESPFSRTAPPAAVPTAILPSNNGQPNIANDSVATPPCGESQNQAPSLAMQKLPSQDEVSSETNVPQESTREETAFVPFIAASPQSLPVKLVKAETNEKAKKEKMFPPMPPSSKLNQSKAKADPKTSAEDTGRPPFMATQRSAPSTPMTKKPKELMDPLAVGTKGTAAPTTPGMQTPATKTSGAVPTAPASAPANLHKVGQQAETPTSASKRGWFDFGIKDYITKKLNPDATTADLGGQMEAYFDEKAGRWVFPGDDPNEVPAALAPPPKTPMAEKVQSAPEPEPSKPKNPLDAMMAPPPSRRPGAKRNLGGALNAAPAFPGTSSGNPAQSAPPQFAVFKPPS
mmetsp:Transcript_11079/g.30605  ORF Transcript_11079/g.30605 Transcript_11079/m.30605 type:complete len:1124 (+) Transcript_11079:3-3374(+)